MKPGKRDIQIYIKFTAEEFDLLQKNSYLMADSYGLDTRIDKLTGKRKISFYSWDLDCIDAVLDYLKKDTKSKSELEVIESILNKLELGYQEIQRKNTP